MIKFLFKNTLSVKKKLMIVTSLVVGFSLLLVLILFVYLNSNNEWSKLNARLAIQAEIIVNNSMPAVIFDDPASAKEILAALKADTNITNAKIIIHNSTIFAEYKNPNTNAHDQLIDKLIQLSYWLKMEIQIEHEIMYQDKKVGVVVITACLHNFYRKNLEYLVLAFLISLSSMFVSLLLSEVLLKQAIDPIIKLTKIARKVSNLRNYSVRADISSKDEVGEFAESFNEMLDVIQRKDSALEKTVAERTSELIQLNKRLQHQAYHDPLTGLANRMLFDDRLQVALSHAQRFSNRVAVLYFDLDHFKTINDTLGHDTGDDLLIAVTDRIKGIVREDDVLCRIGGDEFTMILSSLESTSDIELVAEKLLTAFSKPFLCNQHELTISCSIGISLYPEHSQNKEKLKQFADIAMYHAKNSGRNNYCFFMQQMYKENEQVMVRRVLMKRQLKNAVTNSELQIYYQPQVNLERRIIAVEALLRWENAEHKIIPPVSFIPLAAESGLIQGIEEWAFITVCQHYSKWREAGLPDIKVSLNISGYRLRQPRFNQFIEHTLNDFGLSPDFLIFEITENEIMQNVQEMEKVLNKLHDKGIKVAVDNFGTSYTSLNYLQQLPIDEFKIDAEFIQQLESYLDETSVVNAIISLAASLNKSVVAMGVEQEQQVNYLANLNCHAMQGYLFARPMAEQDIRKMLADNEYLMPRN